MLKRNYIRHQPDRTKPMCRRHCRGMTRNLQYETLVVAIVCAFCNLPILRKWLWPDYRKDKHNEMALMPSAVHKITINSIDEAGDEARLNDPSKSRQQPPVVSRHEAIPRTSGSQSRWSNRSDAPPSITTMSVITTNSRHN